MKRVFTNPLIPKDLEDDLLSATRAHWHLLPDEVREALTAFLAVEAPISLEAFVANIIAGRDSEYLIRAWYLLFMRWINPSFVSYARERLNTFLAQQNNKNNQHNDTP